MSCEPTLLPEPNHVMLNHLYALSIKDGVMVLSTTNRFKKKYVTTLLYKPMGTRIPDEQWISRNECIYHVSLSWITMRVLQSLCFNVKSNYCTIIEKRSNIQFQTTFTWVFSTLKVVTYNFIHLSLFKIFAIHYIFSQQQNNVLCI